MGNKTTIRLLYILLCSALLLGSSARLQASMPVKLSGTLGSTPLFCTNTSQCDLLGLAGTNFTLTTTIDISQAASTTPSPVGNGGWTMTYNNVSLSISGKLSGTCTANLTFTNFPLNAAADTLTLRQCSMPGNTNFSGALWIPQSVVTSVFPGDFPNATIIAAPSYNNGNPQGSFLAYSGLLGNSTYLSMTGDISCNGCSPVPVLNVSPTTLNFTGIAGGASSAQNLTIASSVAGINLPYNVTPHTNSGGNWLTAPATGNTGSSTTLSVTASPASLAYSTTAYVGSVTLTVPGNDVSTNIPSNAPVRVNFTVNPTPTTLGASPSSLGFNYQLGGSQPASQNVTVSTSPAVNLLPVAAAISPTSGTGWLTVPASVTTNSSGQASLAVGINTASLSPGTYNATITLTAPGETNTSPVTVAVTLTVVGPVIVSPASISFTAPSQSLSTTLNVTSNGSSSIPFTASASVTGTTTQWLSVSPASGTATGTATGLTVTASPTGLSPGTYSGSINIVAGGVTTPVPVTFTVVGLQSSSSSLTFNYGSNGSLPAAQQITVGTNGSSAISYTAQASTTSGGNWLSVNGGLSANLTTGATAVTIAVNTAGFAAGTYTGAITLTSTSAFNSPVQIPVTVTVPTLIGVSQSSLTFNYTLLGILPVAQNVSVSTNNSGGTAYSSSVLTNTGGSWLSLPAGGSGTATTGGVTLSVLSAPVLNMLAGTYTGSVTITAPGAANSPLTVGVTFQVGSAPSLTTPAPLSFSMQQNGTPPAAQTFTPASTGGSVSFTAASNNNWLSVSPTSGTTNTTQLSVSLVPANLPPPGSYTGTITINSSNASPSSVTLNVNLTVTAAPSLVPSLSPVSFGYAALSGATVPSQNLSITASDSSSLNYTVASATTSGGSTWLSVTPSSGATGTTNLSVSVNPAALNPQPSPTTTTQYSGTITITASGVANSPLQVPVTLTVSPAANLSLSSNTLTFNYQVGGTVPAAQPVTVSSTGAALNFTTSNGGTGWLQVSPASGSTTSGSISISLNGTALTALAPGTYNGAVTVSSTAAGNSPQTVNVTLNVTALNLTATPQSLTFSEQALGTIPAGQSLSIGTSGSALSYTAAVSAGATNWLAVSPAGGTTGSGSLTVSIRTSNLTAGDYSGSIVVTAGGANNSPFNVPVTLHVTAAPTLQTNHGSLSFSYQQLSANNPASQSLTITASDSSAISFTAAAGVSTTVNNAQWLGVTPTTGTTGSTSLTVSVNPSGLTAGTAYSGSITVTSAAASNSPLVIPVTFTITAAPNLTLGSSSATFNYQTGGSTPASQNVTVAASDSSTMSFSASVEPGAAWLTASAGAGSTPGSVSLGINQSALSALAAGTYNGVVDVTSATAGNSPQHINVTLNVTASNLSLSTNSLQFAFQTGGSTPAGVPVTISSSGAALTYNVAIPPAATWLQASATTGTTGSAVTFSLNPTVLATLAPNTYTAAVSISATGAPNPVTLNVSLVVSNAPSLQLSSLQSFTYVLNGTAPADQTINVGSSGSALNFSASVTAGSNWLSVQQSAGTTPGAITVHINAAGAAAAMPNGGALSGTIHVTSTSNTSNAPLDIPVGLTVVQVQAPASLSFSYLKGGAVPAGQSVNITTNPSVQLAATAGASTTTGGAWLQVSPASGNTPLSLTASMNATVLTGLAAGTYNGSVNVSAGGAQVAVPVTLTVTQPTLTLSQAQSFTYLIGASNWTAPSQQLTLNASGGAAISFSASSNVPWLSVVPSAGTTPSGITVALQNQAALNALAASTTPYQGTVTITSPSAPTITATVNLTVSAPSLSAISIGAFNYQQGSATLPAAQTASVSTPGASLSGASVAVSGAAWLNASLNQTATPATLSVSLVQAGLANLNPGTYNGTITVTVPGASNSPMQVGVTLNVTSAPTISFSTQSLTFNCQSGGACTPASQPVTINGTNNTLTFTATPSAAFIQVSPASGNAGGSITVTPVPTGLSAGAHSGTVTLASTTGVQVGSPLNVTVNIAQASTLSTTQPSLSFQMAVGGSTQPQSVTVTSTGGTLPYTVATSGETWLHLSATAGDTTASSTFGVSLAGAALTPGTYHATITVSSTQSSNPSVNVPVTLTVNPGTLTSSTPAPFAFTLNSGNNPANQTLTIGISSGSGTYTAAVAPGAAWLTASPGGGNLSAGTPANLTLSVNPSGLAAGNYQATVVVSSPLASQNLSVPVTLVVSSAPLLVTSAPSLTFSWQVGTNAPGSQTVTISSSGAPQNFTVAAVANGGGGAWLTATPSSGATGGNASFAVSIVTAGLTAGNYTGSIQVSSGNAGNSPLTIPVSLTVAPPAPISAAPASVSFKYVLGAAAPAAQTLAVTGGSGNGSFTVATNLFTGNGWLSVTPTSGTTPANLNVTVTPGALVAGTYSANITVTSSAGASQVVPVTLVVSNAPLYTLVSGDSLNFTAGVSGGAPPSQSIKLALSTGAAQDFGVTVGGGPWLSASPSSGTTPATITVSVNPAGLAPGTYIGFVGLNVPGASDQARIVPVTLTVSESDSISANPPALAFTFQAGAASVPAVTFTVDSGGAFNLTVTPSGGTWLTASASNSVTPSTITVNVDPTVLAAGSYSGQITVTGTANGLTSTVTVPVAVLVTSNTALAPNPASLTFTYQAGSAAAPASQALAITTTSGLAQNITASASSGGWLQVSPATGATPANLTVSVQTAGLSVGSYNGTISVSGDGALGGAITIPVTLNVTAPPQGLTAQPASLNFDWELATGAPAPQTLSVTAGGLVSAFTATASSGSWLAVSPEASNVPGTVTVSVNPAGLASGTYIGSVLLTPAGGAGGSEAVPVILTVGDGVTTAPLITAVANAASGLPGLYAPGMLISIFGQGMGPSQGQSATAGDQGFGNAGVSATRVLFDGNPAVVVFSQENQVNAIVPFGLAPQSSTALSVEYKGVPSGAVTLPLYPAAPGIFTLDGSGRGPGAIVNQDGTINGPDHPAQRGGWIVLFGTGGGQTSPASTDGSIASGAGQLALPTSVTIDGKAATVLYAGPAPGMVSSAWQINVQVPAGASSGDDSVVVNVGRYASQRVTVRVQ